MTEKQMTALDVLKGARRLLATPDAWTQRSMARTITGVAVTPDAPTAVSWCTVGALCAAAPNPSQFAERAEANRALRQTIGPGHLVGMSVMPWNDREERTHGEVLELFDATIKRLEAEGA